MDRTEFSRRQLTRFSKLASECAHPTIAAELRVIAGRIRDMLRGKASDRAKLNVPIERGSSRAQAVVHRHPEAHHQSVP